jgi:hypothetical protein
MFCNCWGVCFSPVISSLVPAAIPNIPFHLHFTQGGPDGDDDLINYRFSSHDVVCLVCCSVVGAWYLVKKVSCHHIRTLSFLLISCLQTYCLLNVYGPNCLGGRKMNINGFLMNLVEEQVWGCFLLPSPLSPLSFPTTIPSSSYSPPHHYHYCYCWLPITPTSVMKNDYLVCIIIIKN